MYLSAVTAALAPAGVVTRTSTVPVPGGAVATILLLEVTLKTAEVVPKVTALAAYKTLPVIVTLVPPTAGPLLGLRPVTAAGM